MSARWGKADSKPKLLGWPLLTRPGHHRAKRGYSACWRDCMSLTISDAKEQTWLTCCRYVWLDFAMAVSTSHC
jgi:hypothetical protein